MARDVFDVCGRHDVCDVCDVRRHTCTSACVCDVHFVCSPVPSCPKYDSQSQAMFYMNGSERSNDRQEKSGGGPGKGSEKKTVHNL